MDGQVGRGRWDRKDDRWATITLVILVGFLVALFGVVTGILIAILV